MVFLDSHHPNKPEPLYPPHCVLGSGEDLVPGNILFFQFLSMQHGVLYIVRVEKIEL